MTNAKQIVNTQIFFHDSYENRAKQRIYSDEIFFELPKCKTKKNHRFLGGLKVGELLILIFDVDVFVSVQR